MVSDRIGGDAQPGARARAAVEEAEGRAGRAYERTRDAVRHAADEAYDYAEDAYAESRRALREGHDRAADWPHASLVVAGLVGFALGLLARRV